MRGNTIEAFFALVRAGLWETDVQLVSYGEVDYAEVMRLAQEQAVVGLVAAGLEHVSDVKVPQAWALQFAGQTIQLEQRNKAMNQFIADLVAKMRGADIYTLLVKGQGIAQCYERPQWRTSGDIDFFLNEEHYIKAKEFLLTLSKSVDDENIIRKHFSMTIESWAVELHGSMRNSLWRKLDKTIDRIQRDIFNGGNIRLWMNGETKVFLPAPSEDVVLVLSHILQHFFREGIGLRQICDWCRLLWTYRESLNHEYLETRIKEAGVMSEWKAFYNLASRYLGMPDLGSQDSQVGMIGYRSSAIFMFRDAKFDKKADRIMEFILKYGNMGHNRDMSHFSKYPYFIRKCFSMGRRIGDLMNHARIFPLDSLKLFPRIMFNGLRSAMRGE